MTESERTGWHRKVETWLTEEGISFISECGDFSPYKLDIFLTDVWGCVEIDGPGHLKKRDERRDAILRQEYGIVTLRLKASKGLVRAKVTAEILEFMEKAGPTFESRLMRAERMPYVTR